MRKRSRPMKKATSNKKWLMYGLPALAGAIASNYGYADTAAPVDSSGQPTSAYVGEAATPALGTQPTTQSSQAQAKGLIDDSHFNLMFRNYSDFLTQPGKDNRYGWDQTVMANFESGYTKGVIGFGFDASLYAALNLVRSDNAGNYARLSDDGTPSNKSVWAYPAIYDVKARVSDTVLKYGAQMVTTPSNPYMASNDNRMLPPTFLGTTIVSNEFKNMMFEGGRFTKVIPRGQSNLVKLTTTYGTTPVDNLTYVGGTWSYSPTGSISLYADQAKDVWNQYYTSITQSFGDVNAVKWTGFANVYSTHDSGSARQGNINTNAYSASISAQHGAHELLVGYQQIAGDQYFDYIGETGGILLVNSMDSDYNQPHEKSLQLRYTFHGDEAGMPGVKVMLEGVMGWDADGSASAALDTAHTGPYWKNGEPVHGNHHEFGIIPSYTFQGGKLKGTKVTLSLYRHLANAHDYDDSNFEYRLMVNVPVEIL